MAANISLCYVAGIECPRGKRQLPNGQVIEADPYGEEALLFTKEMCLQREVRVRCWDTPTMEQAIYSKSTIVGILCWKFTWVHVNKLEIVNQ